MKGWKLIGLGVGCVAVCVIAWIVGMYREGATTSSRPLSELDAAQFVSADTGWILGEDIRPCATSRRCTWLQRTGDGGRTWHSVNSATLPSDIREFWFANDTFGSVGTYTGEWFTTRDGGDSWQRVAVPGGEVLHRWATAADPTVIRTIQRTADGGLAVSSGPDEHGGWVTSATQPFGRHADKRIVSAGYADAAWILHEDENRIAARMTGGQLSQWLSPCSEPGEKPAWIRALSEKDIVVSCDGPSGSSGLRADRRLVSHDAGDTFTATAEPDISASPTPLTQTGDRIYGEESGNLVVSSDGGRLWNRAYPPDIHASGISNYQPSPGFPTPTDGFVMSHHMQAVEGEPGPLRGCRNALLITHDAGTTWTPVTCVCDGSPDRGFANGTACSLSSS